LSIQSRYGNLGPEVVPVGSALVSRNSGGFVETLATSPVTPSVAETSPPVKKALSIPSPVEEAFAALQTQLTAALAYAQASATSGNVRSAKKMNARLATLQKMTTTLLTRPKMQAFTGG
jgi:hypothetical protein